MSPTRITSKLAVALGLVLAIAASALAQPSPGLPASTRDYPNADVAELDYPVLDGAGNLIGDARWRVVGNTGNCCENYLAATNQGRLLDFGGSFLRYSDDRGITWKEVRPIEPLVSGEGAITVAPNGDLLGMTWDPYSGDHLLTFKFEGGSNSWIYSETKLHTPFFDRPWLAVVKGPFEIGPHKVPYVSILMSNFWQQDVWYVSTDGLNYVIPSHKTVDALVEAMDDGKLQLQPDPAADWTQPQTQSSVTPMSGGGALASDMSPFGDGVPNYVLKGPGLRWKSLPEPKLPRGRLLVDSRGWLHNVATNKDRFIYSISTDGGDRWKERSVALPPGHVVEDFDFRANGALGVTAVAVHARNKEAKVDQDLVYKFLTKKPKPALHRTYFVGDGDLDVGFGLGDNIRFDFPTIAILPDGTIATSFSDSAHTEPTVAILLDTSL